MSWQTYIDNLKTEDQSGMIPVADGAICGMAAGQESIWASSPGLSNISAQEIKSLAAKDRSSFGANGVFIAGQKCRMLRDQLDEEGLHSLQLKTAVDADGNSYNICVGKSKTALVIAKGTKDASGGQVSSKVFITVEHLRKANM